MMQLLQSVSVKENCARALRDYSRLTWCTLFTTSMWLRKYNSSVIIVEKHWKANIGKNSYIENLTQAETFLRIVEEYNPRLDKIEQEIVEAQ